MNFSVILVVLIGYNIKVHKNPVGKKPTGNFFLTNVF